MDEAKIKEVVKAKMAELGISSKPASAEASAGKSGFGKLMGAVMQELKGWGLVVLTHQRKR
jgi:uncharacterized protein YqeY